MNTSTPAPTVSAVIPAYNAAWCIERALHSALDQTQPLFEIIVVNDGSTDNTADIVSTFGNLVTLYNKPNGGLSSARNAGIKAAKGDWIAFLDADDYWLPEKTKIQITHLLENRGLGFCSTKTRVENEAGATTGYWDCPIIENSTLHTIFACNAAVAGSGSSVIARRQSLLEAGLFDENLQSLEDIDMWMRLSARVGYACIDSPLSVILKHSGSMSGNREIMRSSALAVMKKNRHLIPQNNFWQRSYASVLCDYAKWEYRDGLRITAILHTLEALARAPLSNGRLALGLIVAMIIGQKI